MADIEKVKKGLECCLHITRDCPQDCPYERMAFCRDHLHHDALELLKEQQAKSVDAFIQWCADSHMIGYATLNGIKYWVEKYKEFVSKGR